MTYQEALSYIHKTDWKGSVLGLDRIRTLLHLLGDPQDDLSFIHVAGTNGKGSVSSFLTSVLSESGYRTGLFTSPFLFEFRERIRIGETLITEEELIRAVEAVAPFADSMTDAVTEFELMTAIAFWYFREQKCDVVVCEVGLGGELDSTNVIKDPLLSVITTIDLDHTDRLGGTIADIARAKAGIIKKGCPVLFGEADNPDALAVISARAAELGAFLSVSDRAELTVHASDLSGSRFSYRAFSHVCISLCGAYQPQNAMVALDALTLVRPRLVRITDEAVYKGLQKARWQGRFEVFSAKAPVVIVDGAHNPHGAQALLSSLEQLFDSDARFLALCAVMADKDYCALFASLLPKIERVFAVAPSDQPRALDAKKLAAFCGESGVLSAAFSTVEEGVVAALCAAKEQDLPLLVFGSLYLYKEASTALKKHLS